VLLPLPEVTVLFDCNLVLFTFSLVVTFQEVFLSNSVLIVYSRI